MKLLLLGVAAFLVLLTACSTAAEGLPSGGHLHSLGVVTDGPLLMGLHEGFYRSEDGVRWELAGLEGEDAMALGTVAPDLVVVAGHEVLARSEDGGETFVPLRPADLPSLDVHALAQAPTQGEVLYAYVVGFGLYRSEDGGETWEQRADLTLIPPDLVGLSVAGAGTDGLVAVGAESGIWLSVDGGESFERVEEVPAWSVTVDPADPDRLLALTAAGVVESEDAGETWSSLALLEEVEGQPVALAVGSGELWVAAEQPRGLYVSEDGGSSWELVASA